MNLYARGILADSHKTHKHENVTIGMPARCGGPCGAGYTQKEEGQIALSLLLGGGYLLSHFRSTIGVVRLNFSVRNGKRWDPHAITTLVFFRPPFCGRRDSLKKSLTGNALRLLQHPLPDPSPSLGLNRAVKALRGRLRRPARAASPRLMFLSEKAFGGLVLLG